MQFDMEISYLIAYHQILYGTITHNIDCQHLISVHMPMIPQSCLIEQFHNIYSLTLDNFHIIGPQYRVRLSFDETFNSLDSLNRLEHLSLRTVSD